MKQISNKYRKLQGVKAFLFLAMLCGLTVQANAQVLQPLGTGLPSSVVASYATATEYYALFEDKQSPQPNDYTLGIWDGVYWKYLPGLFTPQPILPTQGTYNFHSIAVFKGEIYVGAYLANASQDAEVPVTNLYKWNKSSHVWDPEIGVVDTRNDGIVTMTVFDGRLIVAGKFKSTVNGNSVQNIAAYDGTSWNYLGTSDIDQGADGIIRSLTVIGNRLYIAGDFQNFAGSATGNIAYFTAANGGWGGIGSPFKGVVNELAYYNGQIAAIGQDSLGNYEVRTFKSNWSKPISFDSFTVAKVKTIAGTSDFLLLGGEFVKNGNGSSLLTYNDVSLSFTGNRLQGDFNLGQRGESAFVWGDFIELNTGIQYFSIIEATAGNLFGDLFYDINGDCQKGENEYGIPNGIIRVLNKDNNTARFVVTDNKGHFSISLPEGDYSLQHTPERHMQNICTVNYATRIRNGKYSSVSLGEYMTPTIKDLEVQLYPVYPSELKAGDTIKTVLIVKNHGASKLSGTTIHVVHNSRLTNFHSYPAADNIENNDATFALVDMEPFETKSIELLYRIPEDASVVDFYPLTVKTGSLFTQTDAFQTDNLDTLKLSIGKRGNANGAVEKSSDAGLQVDYRSKSLLYTVNFKNIGSQTVNKAVMIDTLSNVLPMQRVILKSFYPTNATYSIQQGRILVVNFNPANLKSAEASPLESNGWVQYQIDLYETLPHDTKVDNLAMVDFDSEWRGYSENCQVTMVNPSISVRKLSKSSLVIFPNPSSQNIQVNWLNSENNTAWIISNIMGAEVKMGYIDITNPIVSVKDLEEGIYFLKTNTTVTKIQVLR